MSLGTTPCTHGAPKSVTARLIPRLIHPSDGAEGSCPEPVRCRSQDRTGVVFASRRLRALQRSLSAQSFAGASSRARSPDRSPGCHRRFHRGAERQDEAQQAANTDRGDCLARRARFEFGRGAGRLGDVSGDEDRSGQSSRRFHPRAELNRASPHARHGLGQRARQGWVARHVSARTAREAGTVLSVGPPLIASRVDRTIVRPDWNPTTPWSPSERRRFAGGGFPLDSTWCSTLRRRTSDSCIDRSPRSGRTDGLARNTLDSSAVMGTEHHDRDTHGGPPWPAPRGAPAPSESCQRSGWAFSVTKGHARRIQDISLIRQTGARYICVLAPPGR